MAASPQCVVALTTFLCLIGLTPRAASPQAPLPRAAAPAVTAAARACGPLPAFDQAAADEIMAGRLTIAPWPAVTIDPRRDGDIDWRLDRSATRPGSATSSPAAGSRP